MEENTMALSNSVRSMLLAAAITVSFAGAASAQQDNANNIDWKKGGKWSQLAQYIGTYQYNTVLQDTAVKTELERITKGYDIDLSAEFEVSAPIGFQNDCLIMQGNRVHKGDTNRAYLETCLFQGTVNFAVFDHDKIIIYTSFKEYRHLSEGMRNWIYFQNNPTTATTQKPDTVQMVTQPQ